MLGGKEKKPKVIQIASATVGTTQRLVALTDSGDIFIAPLGNGYEPTGSNDWRKLPVIPDKLLGLTNEATK